MDLKPGSKYEENVKKLKEAIMRGSICAVEVPAINNLCYFCRKHIEGTMTILTEIFLREGIEGKTQYFLDNTCYQSNRIFEN